MSEHDGRDGNGEEAEETVVEILGFEDDAEAPAAAAAGDATESAPSANERRLESALAVERERCLRLRADLDNFRKRAERERAEVERYASAEVARELLPVVDNLERALAAVPGEGDDLRKGVEMILRQLEEILRRIGVTKVASLGERFDPSHHEAVLHEESDEVEVPTVVAELQRGYRLNDRLIRPAMVKVAMPMDEAGPAPEAE